MAVKLQHKLGEESASSVQVRCVASEGEEGEVCVCGRDNTGTKVAIFRDSEDTFRPRSWQHQPPGPSRKVLMVQVVDRNSDVPLTESTTRTKQDKETHLTTLASIKMMQIVPNSLS